MENKNIEMAVISIKRYDELICFEKEVIKLRNKTIFGFMIWQIKQLKNYGSNNSHITK